MVKIKDPVVEEEIAQASQVTASYSCDFCDAHIEFDENDQEMDEDGNFVGEQFNWRMECVHRALNAEERATRKGHIRRNFDASEAQDMTRARQVVANFSNVAAENVTTCPDCLEKA